MSVVFNSEVTLPETGKTGHTFLGWYYGEILVESGPWLIPSNVTLVARWKANSYSVQLSVCSSIFNYVVRYHEKDSVVTTKEYKYGDDISVYIPPSSEGNYFDGWFTDSALTEPLTFKDGFKSKETDLYAKYVSKPSQLLADGVSRQYPIEWPAYFSNYYFHVPVSGDYSFEINFNLHMWHQVSETFYLNLWITDDSTGKYYVKQQWAIDNVDTHIPYSGTLSLNAGDRVRFEETLGTEDFDNSNWVIKISSVDKLTCYYDPEEFAFPITFNESYNLGVPVETPSEKSFVGWYTEENGQGTKVTDSDGKSLVPWNFTTDKVFYPYFN